jgi:hypothetical protein
MYMNSNRILQTITGTAIMAIAMMAGAQAPVAQAPAPGSDAAQPSNDAILKDLAEMKARIAQLEAEQKAHGETAPASAAPAPADQAVAAPAAPTWSVGPLDVSGFIDGYYSYNANRPSDTANGQANDLYNFNDKTDQFNLNAAKLTLSHDPDPVGVHVDFLFGRANTFMNSSDDNAKYIEQAFVSIKPPTAKGFELDFGKFVTSAGAEVIETKDNWNYSRSLLFAWAIPYYHFGARTSIPVSKTETLGVQVVNGWNNVTDNNGGVTLGLTSAYAKPKYTWYANYYTGPENTSTQKGYRNLIDTTLLLTPSAKFSAYLNYDYGQNRDGVTSTGSGDDLLNHWQGVALAARGQVTATSTLAGRFEYFSDRNGWSTGTPQAVKEFTGTYEYKWAEGLLARAEYRRDWSTEPSFHKGDTELVKAQSTLTVGFVAFFGPKR